MGFHKHHIEHVAVVHSGVNVGHLLDRSWVDFRGVFVGAHKALSACRRSLANAIDALGHLLLEPDHLVVPKEEMPVGVWRYLRLQLRQIGQLDCLLTLRVLALHVLFHLWSALANTWTQNHLLSTRFASARALLVLVSLVLEARDGEGD